MADDGQGTTIAFASSGFIGEFIDVGGPNYTRDSYETSHMGTTVAKTFNPVDLYDPGEGEFEIAYDPDKTPPITGANEVVTITDPIPTGMTVGAKRQCLAHVTSFSINRAMGARMTATIGLKFSGVVTHTAAS